LCRVPKQGVPTINDQEKQTSEKTTPKTQPTETGRAKTTNETPRPRSDSHETRSIGRLDHVPTRTRLAWRNTSTTEKSPTRTTLGRADRPTSLTNSETKVRAFNVTANHFLPSWLQQQPAWKQYQCQISLFTVHPGKGGENLSLCVPYRALFRHWSPSRENTTSVVPRNSRDSALSIHRRPTSTWPRPTAGQTRKQGLHDTGPGVFSPSHPLRHHGVRG
jgi:hypothetical protein